MDQVDAWLQTRVTNKLGVLIKPLIGRIEIHVRNIVPIKLFRIWTDETFIHRFRRTWAAISQLRRWWWNFEFRPLSLRPTPPGAPQKILKLNEWRMNVSLNHFLDKKKCLDKHSETVGRNVTAIYGVHTLVNFGCTKPVLLGTEMKVCTKHILISTPLYQGRLVHGVPEVY